MWMLRLKTGLELTEHELKCWDNVPKDVEIKEFALSLSRNKKTPYIIAISGYEEICCATMASAISGGEANIVGRVIYCIKGDSVTEMMIQGDGIRLKIYPKDKFELRPSCLRRMVG